VFRDAVFFVEVAGNDQKLPTVSRPQNPSIPLSNSPHLPPPPGHSTLSPATRPACGGPSLRLTTENPTPTPHLSRTSPTTTDMTSLIRLVRRPVGAGRENETNPHPENQAQKIAAKDSVAATGSRSPSTAVRRTRRRPTFATLPPEIHLLIAEHLIYPDALSLKHTNRYFFQLVDTGIELKVEWLMERRLLHLECPSDQRCDLGSDLRFCRGSVK